MKNEKASQERKLNKIIMWIVINIRYSPKYKIEVN